LDFAGHGHDDDYASRRPDDERRTGRDASRRPPGWAAQEPEPQTDDETAAGKRRRDDTDGNDDRKDDNTDGIEDYIDRNDVLRGSHEPGRTPSRASDEEEVSNQTQVPEHAQSHTGSDEAAQAGSASRRRRGIGISPVRALHAQQPAQMAVA